MRWIGSLSLVMALLPVAPASAADLPHHHLAFFAGLGVETKKDHENENGFAVGGQYELRFHKNWGVGGIVEFLGQDTVRDLVLVFPVSIHPGGGWRLFAGPGVEIRQKKRNFWCASVVVMSFIWPVTGASLPSCSSTSSRT